MPTAVAFVMYGIHASNGKLLDAHICEHKELFHTPIDICKILWNNPTQRTRLKCNKNCNGSDPSSQIRILDDRRFYDACGYPFKVVEKYAR